MSTEPTTKPAAPQPTNPGMQQRGRMGGNRGGRGRSRNNREDGPKDEFDMKLLLVRRVSRSYKGGKRLRISACVAVGDRAGKVGVGIGRGVDVRDAQTKAIAMAKSNLIVVPLKGNTLPHNVLHKQGAAKLVIKPAAPGTGIIAGSTIRAVLELAGVKDALSKVLGSRNQINNAYATVDALKSMRANKL